MLSIFAGSCLAGWADGGWSAVLGGSIPSGLG